MATTLAAPKKRLDFLALQHAVLAALQKGHGPLPLRNVLQALAEEGQSFDDIEARRAIWSLIAKHHLELTDDWRLSVP